MVWRCLFEPAGADGDVGAGVEGGEETLGFFDGRGEVGVSEHDDLARGLEEAVADGVAFAAVAVVVDEMEVGVSGHPALDDVGGVVGGAVVDDEDFGIPAALGDAGEYAIEGVLDPGALVVGGDHDAEAGRVHVPWSALRVLSALAEFMIRHFLDSREQTVEGRGDAVVTALLDSAA